MSSNNLCGEIRYLITIQSGAKDTPEDFGGTDNFRKEKGFLEEMDPA